MDNSLSSKSEDDAELFQKVSGVSSCPADRFCLYTNYLFNEKEVGDMLAIRGNVQLNAEQLRQFGFSVGQHDGVSSVVNKLSTVGALVKGTGLDGDFFKINAGDTVPIFAGDWNDAANSVVTQEVTRISISVSIDGAEMFINSSTETTLTIRNESPVDISVGVSVTEGQNLVSIGQYDTNLTVLANSVVVSKISLMSGAKVGKSDLVATIRPEIGFVNSNSNSATGSIIVREIPVDLSVSVQDVNMTISSSAETVLTVSNASNIPITVGVSIAAQTSLVSVTSYESSLHVNANSTANTKVALSSGTIAGECALRAQITPESGYENTGSNYGTGLVQVVLGPLDFEITQEYKLSWESWWPVHCWMYSYHLILISHKDTIHHWKFSFKLPEGAQVDPDWLVSQSSWLEKNEQESVDGYVVLQNTEGHIVAPNSDIGLDIIIQFPDKHADHEMLSELTIQSTD